MSQEQQSDKRESFNPVKFYREFPAGGNNERGDWLSRCLTAMLKASRSHARENTVLVLDEPGAIASAAMVRLVEEQTTPSTTPQKPGETPRTDALSAKLHDLTGGFKPIDLWDHARQLERELAEAMNRCDEALEAAEAAVSQRDSALSATLQSEQLRSTAALALGNLATIRRFLPQTPEGDDLDAGAIVILRVLEECLRRPDGSTQS